MGEFQISVEQAFNTAAVSYTTQARPYRNTVQTFLVMSYWVSFNLGFLPLLHNSIRICPVNSSTEESRFADRSVLHALTVIRSILIYITSIYRKKKPISFTPVQWISLFNFLIAVSEMEFRNFNIPSTFLSWEILIKIINITVEQCHVQSTSNPIHIHGRYFL